MRRYPHRVRYRFIATRIETMEHTVTAASEDEAEKKVRDELLRTPWAYAGRWDTQAIEVQIIDTIHPTPAAPPVSDTGGRLLSIKNAAAELGLPYSALYRLVTDGQIEHTLIGSRKYIAREDLEAFIQANRRGGAERP